VCVLIVAIFPSIEGSPQLHQLIDSYPEASKEAFGVTEASFRTIEGHLASEVFSLIAPLAAAYFVIHALASAVCGSEQRGVIDVLVSAPLRRRQLLDGWLAAVAAVLAVILLVAGILCQLAALALGVDLAFGNTLDAVANLWPLSVFFGGPTLLLAGLSSRTLAVTGIATSGCTSSRSSASSRTPSPPSMGCRPSIPTPGCSSPPPARCSSNAATSEADNGRTRVVLIRSG
jgi:putative exporter of polyketide antibiotics